MNAMLSPLVWKGDHLSLLDQLLLPGSEVWIECRTVEVVADAIRDMQVRGAPAIGCAAAYGAAIEARRLATADDSGDTFAARLEPALVLLSKTRPTAVNLFWALDQVRAVLAAATGSAGDIAAAIEQRAVDIHRDDIAMCQRIGEHGNTLIPDNATVLTHCNAGALATGGYGTALGVLRSAKAAGKTLRVLADETRPYLQGARLTAWELDRDGFDVTIVPDSAAAFLISRGEVSCIVVGADRIAANGDVANKIGTYAVALAAHHNNVPFYVAAPASTIDLSTASGADIPIEERAGKELTHIGDTAIAPAGVEARYPAFDITPNNLVAAIITDTGIARAPYQETLPTHVR